jgi:hypothetical protein
MLIPDQARAVPQSRIVTIFSREIAFSRVPMMGFEPIPRFRGNGF